MRSMSAIYRFLLGAWFALVLCGAVIRAQTADSGDRPVLVKTSLDVMMPEKLRALLLDRPSVRFLVTVSDDNHLIEYLAVEATHHELLERAEEVLRKTEFGAATRQGQAVQATAEVRVTFFDPEQRALQDGLTAQPFGATSSEAAARRLYANAKDRHVFRQSEPAELDAPLSVAEGKLVVLADDEGHTAVGRCVLDYYVDYRGQPRIPRIVSSDNDTVMRSALLTLQKLRFTPPTRDGLPTCVKVRQPFIYEAGAEPSGS